MGIAKCSIHPTRNQFITIVLIRFGTSPTAIVSISFIVGASITDTQPDPRIGDQHRLLWGVNVIQSGSAAIAGRPSNFTAGLARSWVKIPPASR
jgi:hypothetical protein